MPASGPPLTGVALLNMGGPDSLSAVRPFLFRLFSDRDLIPLPAGAVTQPVFAWIASGVRARTVRRHYEEIGGGSPIGALTEAQRYALENALRDGAATTGLRRDAVLATRCRSRGARHDGRRVARAIAPPSTRNTAGPRPAPASRTSRGGCAGRGAPSRSPRSGPTPTTRNTSPRWRRRFPARSGKPAATAPSCFSARTASRRA
jgi:hypothetical protein